MGFIQDLRHQGTLEGLGQKVKNGVAMFGKAKGLWETGKAIYNGVQTVLPYVSEMAAFL
jgi:hypothetical protein